MTHLREMMLEELERCNYSQTTIECFLCFVAEFSLHFPPSEPLRIGAHPPVSSPSIRRRKLAPSTVTQHLAALRSSRARR